MEESIYKLTGLRNSRGDSDRRAGWQLREVQQAGDQAGGRDDDPNLAQGLVNLFLVQFHYRYRSASVITIPYTSIAKNVSLLKNHKAP